MNIPTNATCPDKPLDDVSLSHRIPMVSNKDVGQSDIHNPSSKKPQLLAPADEVSAETKTRKLSVRERLNRLSKYRINPSSIDRILDTIGRGGKAEVVRAYCIHNGGEEADVEQVVVKKLQYGDSMDKEKFSKEFVHEVEMLAGLSHEHIIQLIGFVEDLDHDKAWIVLSWEPNGNVREFLASGEWEIPERLSLIKDTFEGLKYLHTRQPPICHGDLKSLNILVSSSCRAIITDFGSSRALSNVVQHVVDQENVPDASGIPTMDKSADCRQLVIIATSDELTLTGPAWSLRWAAPEVIKEEEQPSLPSDIWSAGWVCWEIVTGEIPFHEIKAGSAVMLHVITGKVPSIRENTQLAQVTRLCSLMSDCWAFDPKARPSAVRCFNEAKWMPSTTPGPLGGTPSGLKVASTELLLQMGHLHYSQDRYESAAALFQQALETARDEEDQQASAAAMQFLAKVYYAQCKDTEAVSSYAEAHEIYVCLGDDLGQANTLYGLGEVHHVRCKDAEAAEFYTRAQEIYSRIENDSGRAVTILGLGDVYRAQCKYPEAVASYAEAQAIYARIGDDLGRANTLHGLGSLLRLQCKYVKAGESHSEAYNIYARIGDDLGRANTLVELGAVHHAQCKYSEAAESYAEAQEIYTRIGDDQGRANTVHGLGEVRRAQCKYIEAAESYAAAQEIYSRIDDDQGRADALDGLGYIHSAQCKYIEAAELHTRAQDIYSRIGDERGRASTLNGMGDIHRARREHIDAAECYIKAQEIYTRIGDDLGRANTLRSLGQVRQEQGRSIDAASFYAEARDLYTQIGRSTNAEEVSRWLAALSNEQDSYITSQSSTVHHS